MSEAAVGLTGLSSMATRLVLAALVEHYQAERGGSVCITSIGGVDAEARVLAGEAVDLIWLAAAALNRLDAAGCLLPGSRRSLMRSDIWVAVREHTARPPIGSEEQVHQAVLAAPTLGYSTGPSGTHLTGLLKRWGIWERIQPRLIKAPAGVPVAALIACGEVALGFQQRSELVSVEGVDAIGPLPEAIQYATVFCGAVCAGSTNPRAAQDLLDFMASAEAAAILLAHGMAPA